MRPELLGEPAVLLGGRGVHRCHGASRSTAVQASASSAEFLGDFPAGPDPDHAADPAEQETAEELEAERLAEIPEAVTDHGGADEDAEFVHAGTLRETARKATANAESKLTH